MLAAAIPAQAAELGDPVVRSFLGQPIVADIELLPDEGGAVTVKLANPNVYRGANLAVHPILASVYFSVMRRDGRQYLHVTSLKPNESESVPMFLELLEKGKPSVRQVTLHFIHDPNPPPPPPPPPPPSKPTLTPESLEPGEEEVLAAPLPKPAPKPMPASPQRKPAAAPANVRLCAEMDYKNTQLSAQIVELEEKVKSLQAAVETAHASASAAAAAVKTVPGPSTATKAKAAKKKPDAEPINWALYGGIGGGVVAVLGLIGFVLRRRKKAKSGEVKPGFFARLKRKEEPHLEEAPAAEPPAET
jgi:pilus assembly protein FimV